MPVTLKVGDRIQARCTSYPARSGAVGRIIEVMHVPAVYYIVEWEQPAENLVPNLQSYLLPAQLGDFIVLDRARD